MAVNRRTFMQRCSAAVSSAFAANALTPSFSFAQNPVGAKINIIEIFLAGGADARYLYPYLGGAVGDAIANRRATLTVPQQDILTPNNFNQNGRSNPIGFHPSFGALVSAANQYNAGIACITEYGATQNPSRSHEIATRQRRASSLTNPNQLSAGWVGRVAQTFGLPSAAVWGFGISGGHFTNVTDGEKPFVVSGLGSLNFRNFATGSFDGTANANRNSVQMRDAFRRLQAVAADEAEGDLQEILAASQDSILDTVPLAVRMRNAVSVDVADFRGPNNNNNLANSCSDIARAIHYLNLNPLAPNHVRNGTKIFATSRGGWDSHGNQANSIPGNISVVANAIAGLVQYLSAWGLLENTIILVESEFGRTTEQNGSLGTDHAEAGHMLVVGGANIVRRGVFGPEASLTEATNRNFFTAQVPFTGILRTILNQAFDDQQRLNQVFANPMPGSVPNFLA